MLSPLENEVVDDTQRYPVNDINILIACELHVKPKNISALVGYGSALPVFPGCMIHGMPIPLGYSTITMEQIVGT